MNGMPNGAILGVGAYLPDTRVFSHELMAEADSRRRGIPEKFLERVSGIRERRFASESDTPSTMASRAATVAIKDAGIDPLDIDMVLFCGIERDYAEPATAHLVADQIGARNAVECFDVANACHGVMSGVSVANAYIATGQAESVLVCTGEKPSLVSLDIVRQLKQQNKSKKEFKDLMGALTVGDAGGAFIVGKSASPDVGFRSMQFSSKSQYHSYCYYRHEKYGVKFQMLMDKICSVGVNMHKAMIDATYKKLGWTPQSVDKVYCHQTGARPHVEMAKLARQPVEKAPISYELYGNLTSATIPVTMHLNKATPGSRCLILSAGSGVSVGQTGLTI